MVEVVRNPVKTLLTSNTVEIRWSDLDQDDSGQAAQVMDYPDMTVQATGTFNSGTITLYGSNDIAAVRADIGAGTLFASATAEWTQIVDPQGNGIAFTARGGEVLLENYAYILPVVTGGGASTDLEVSIVCHLQR